MIETTARGILLDIEGTTSSIDFVYDTMFPYVRENVAEFVVDQWQSPDFRECLEWLAKDLNRPSADVWLDNESTTDQQNLVCRAVLALMDADVKATGLKQLQGLIWKSGFESGQLVAHIYEDVPAAIKNWNAAGCDVRIYSSGSIAAQKLFFGHTIAGDLLDQFRGHYDTTTGGKKESQSYQVIAGEFRLEPGEILFISDSIEELIAARAAGMQTLLSIRPGNPAIAVQHDFDAINSFLEIDLAVPADTNPQP